VLPDLYFSYFLKKCEECDEVEKMRFFLTEIVGKIGGGTTAKART
jgi:hypothetical protein